MKKLLTLLFLSLCFTFTKAQNLVPNPSFEDTIDCYTPKFWTSFGNSPDYYNPCDNSISFGTPINGAGYQYANYGSAYIGLFSYLTIISNQREFMGVKLIDSLVPNVRYYVNFKINLANMSNAATNHIGVLFTKYKYNDTLMAALNNNAQVFSNLIISDTINWVKLSGSFIADSAYSYLVIGNFFNDLNTSITTLSASGTGAYYFIDDICVSTDSFACDMLDGINSISQPNTVHIFPNPVINELSFRNLNSDEYIFEVRNILGQSILYQTTNNQNSFTTDISFLPNGVYFLTIKTSETSQTIKFIKQSE